MHYKEWDTLLSGGILEPKAITEKLPEFLEFIKEAQAVLFHDKSKYNHMSDELSLLHCVIIAYLSLLTSVSNFLFPCTFLFVYQPTCYLKCTPELVI